MLQYVGGKSIQFKCIKLKWPHPHPLEHPSISYTLYKCQNSE